jgi:hypothetical protein
VTDFGKIAIAAEMKSRQLTIKHGLQRELSGRLKISIVSTGKYVMPYFLSDFLKRNPE